MAAIHTETFRKTVLKPMGTDFSRVTYPIYRICDQARLFLGLLEADLETFKKKKIPVTKKHQETVETCLQVLAEEGADRAETELEPEAYNELVTEGMRRFGDLKEETILWAKASETLDWRVFHLNMGQGSVPRFLEAGRIFVELIERHGKALPSPERAKEIGKQAKKILDEIEKARVARGLVRADVRGDTLTIQQACRVLYDTLLHISRLGRATFFHDLGRREAYRLSLLHPNRPDRTVGDDDAPVLEPEVAEATGVTLPAPAPAPTPKPEPTDA